MEGVKLSAQAEPRVWASIKHSKLSLFIFIPI